MLGLGGSGATGGALQQTQSSRVGLCEDASRTAEIFDGVRCPGLSDNFAEEAALMNRCCCCSYGDLTYNFTNYVFGK